MIKLFQTFMQGIADLFGTIVTVFRFGINLLSSLLTFLTHLPQYVSFALNSVNVLPDTLIPFAVAAVSIYFVLRLINRSAKG